MVGQQILVLPVGVQLLPPQPNSRFDPFGNKIDWVQALNEGKINPEQSLYDEEFALLKFDKLLELKTEWTRTPAAIYPHDAHNRWLVRGNCHPAMKH